MQFVHEPGIQFVVRLEPQPRREEALGARADLVLDLTLLPTGRRRASDRLDKVMRAHLQEAAMIGDPYRRRSSHCVFMLS